MIPRLYVCDLAHARYSSVSASPDSDDFSAQNTVDGDPNSLMQPGADHVTWNCILASALKVRGIAISNHNLAGGWLSASVRVGGTMIPLLAADTVDSAEDLLRDAETASDEATEVQIDIGDVPANIKIGCISILADYGYNYQGNPTEGEGFGIIELGGTGDEGYMILPISTGGGTGIVALTSTNGFTQFQRLACPSRLFAVRLTLMRMARGYEGDRLWNAYYPRKPRAIYANPGLYKGAWLVMDDFDVTAPAAIYVTGDPGRELGVIVDTPGGRASAELYLREVARESVA
jgi:hypothetical protein